MPYMPKGAMNPGCGMGEERGTLRLSFVVLSVLPVSVAAGISVSVAAMSCCFSVCETAVSGNRTVNNSRIYNCFICLYFFVMARIKDTEFCEVQF